MTSLSVQPVILCGGGGARLWPLSRTAFPKQFLCLTEDASLFQQTAKRLASLACSDFRVEPPLIVSNEEHRYLVLEQLHEIAAETSAVLLEPTARNTAPALTLAALAAVELGTDPILVVSPADHMITDQLAFGRTLREAIKDATDGAIVTLGVIPDCPATGYGYIRAKRTGAAASESNSFFVERFVEKPDLASAQRYLTEGDYYWNAGIFILKASVWLAALRCFHIDMAQSAVASWEHRAIDAKFVRPHKDLFTAVPSESIDYAVLEHCPGSQFTLKMVTLDAGWSDLGAWDGIWQILPKDQAGNAHRGDVVTTGSRNTLVHATSRLVGLVGVENLIVVETPDAVLVANCSRSQDVRTIVSALHNGRRQEHNLHRKVHRPWGWYDNIDEGNGFKVKRIHVKPNGALSLQKHVYRAEHWVVVRGTAEVTCGKEKTILKENQSTYIPVGETHRLANAGDTPLEIIEVQSGSYLGEDDIVRLEDQYGRINRAL